MGEQLTVSTLMDVYETKEPMDLIQVDQFKTKKELYEIQAAFVQEKRRTQGGSISGYKISLTNVEMQQTLETDMPLYGTILNQDIAATGKLSIREFENPFIEPELIFITREDLSLDADQDEILAKTTIAPGLELPDSRLSNDFSTLSVADLICDNALAGKVVIGEPRRINNQFKLDEITVTLSHNDRFIAQGQSTFVLENPLNAVLWLHRELAAQGKVIKKGTIISSGTFMQPLPLEIGIYRAVFDHFGEVEIHIKE